jgi:GntR family transcriptional regulator/MocR family aminotransferase
MDRILMVAFSFAPTDASLWSIKKYQEVTKIVYHGDMTKPLNLQLDRSAKTPLTEQIRKGITAAIESGVLAPGARLPSWLDLAAQLGVARGTVRSAYEKLSAAQLIVAARATGTHVADRLSIIVRQEEAPDPGSFMEM